MRSGSPPTQDGKKDGRWAPKRPAKALWLEPITEQGESETTTPPITLVTISSIKPDLTLLVQCGTTIKDPGAFYNFKTHHTRGISEEEILRVEK